MDRALHLAERAAIHAALGDPLRLAIVDQLTVSDRTPGELADQFGVAPPLLAHHLDVLESAGVIARRRSDGDGRRRYVRLRMAIDGASVPCPARVLFVCTRNSARSQLAQALWEQRVGRPARSAGTHPAGTVHPGAVRAGKRCGIDLTGARPSLLQRVPAHTQVITVCDRAGEELGTRSSGSGAGRGELPSAWHWSIPDPVPDGRGAAFAATVDELTRRIRPFEARAGGGR